MSDNTIDGWIRALKSFNRDLEMLTLGKYWMEYWDDMHRESCSQEDEVNRLESTQTLANSFMNEIMSEE